MPEKKVILHELEGHKDTVRGLAYSPDGRKLATISYDGTTLANVAFNNY